MSQTGPAPRPVSRRSSRSPARHDYGLPTPYASLSGNADARPESGRVTSAEFSGRPQQIQIPPRASLGVHNILNPPELRSAASEGGPPPSSLPNESPMTTAGPSSAPYGGPRSFFAGNPTSGSHPGTPAGAMTPLARPSSSGRNSPATGYPFPPVNNQRKILSPKPPRQTSIGHVGQPMDRRQSLMPSSSPVKRPYEPAREDTPRALHGMYQSSGRPHPMSRHDVSRSRSISQPVSRHHEGPPGGPPPTSGGDAPGRPQSLYAQPPFQHGPPTSRPTSSMGGMGEGIQGWPDMLHRSGMGGAVVGTEGQQAFMTLPGSDTLIPVQVDYSQASKKADEKRQRNAKASTRHRRKKKTLQEENVKQLQDLRDERQEMGHQIDAIARQRDFYRIERNRLRDIIARTPAISQLAAGPPSPTSTVSSGSYADGSPINQARHIPTPTQGYASEASSAERPAQRRRTDDRSEYGMPAFGTPSGEQAAALPPMHGQGYGGPPRPHSAASSASGERLPPLRAMEGPAPAQGMAPGQPHEQDPRTGQWRPVQPRQYETGWATGPRKPPDGAAW